MTQLAGATWTDEEADLRKRFEAGETIVVNMSQAKKSPHRALVKWLKETKQLTRIDNKSKWGNPHNAAFRDKEITREEAVERYKRDLQEELRAAARGELSGKALGCWCKPNGCHGDYLKEL